MAALRTLRWQQQHRSLSWWQLHGEHLVGRSTAEVLQAVMEMVWPLWPVAPRRRPLTCQLEVQRALDGTMQRSLWPARTILRPLWSAGMILWSAELWRFIADFLHLSVCAIASAPSFDRQQWRTAGTPHSKDVMVVLLIRR